jgi:hypothetical protein
MTEDAIAEDVLRLVTGICSMITTAIAIVGFAVARRAVMPMLKETHEKTIETLRQATETAINTNSLTERLVEKTDAFARSEAVRGERKRVAEGRPEENAE